MDTEFYTATMADVYAQQGHLQKALEIYRHLLEREPDRIAFKEALSGIEERIRREAPMSDPDLIVLCRKWIRLLLRYRRLKQLKRYQKTLSV